MNQTGDTMTFREVSSLPVSLIYSFRLNNGNTNNMSSRTSSDILPERFRAGQSRRRRRRRTHTRSNQIMPKQSSTKSEHSPSLPVKEQNGRTSKQHGSARVQKSKRALAERNSAALEKPCHGGQGFYQDYVQDVIGPIFPSQPGDKVEPSRTRPSLNRPKPFETPSPPPVDIVESAADHLRLARLNLLERLDSRHPLSYRTAMDGSLDTSADFGQSDSTNEGSLDERVDWSTVPKRDGGSCAVEHLEPQKGLESDGIL
jgi:hypothetical protein